MTPSSPSTTRLAARAIGPAFAPTRWADLLAALIVAATSAVVGYTVIGHRILGGALLALAVMVWLLAHVDAACVLLGLAIPFFQNVAGGHFGLNVALSDLLLVLITGAVLAEASATRSIPALRWLRPVLVPVAAYASVLFVLLAYHAGAHEAIKTGQRLELFALPLLIGSYTVLRRLAHRVLLAYLLSCTALAVIWPLNNLGMQKNPTGQFIANAILLLVAVRSLRRWLFLTPLLIFGLFMTQSRGALLATGVGLIAILVMQGGRSPRLLLARVVPLALLVLVGFHYLPQDVQQRTTTFSSGTTTRAQYSIHIRDQYKADARQIIAAHKWSGLGVGDYRAGSDAAGTTTTDPHEVLLLQAAEGGYALEAAFVVLVAGSAIAIAVVARRSEFGAAAVGVLLATVGHGLVDVYWVRSTPVLGWFLVGAACAASHRRLRDA